MLCKFDLLTVNNMLDPMGLNNYSNLGYTKYLITNTDLHIDGFININLKCAKV